MINRVVKQPCQVADQVKDITSGRWQGSEVDSSPHPLFPEQQLGEEVSEEATGWKQLITQSPLSTLALYGDLWISRESFEQSHTYL